MTTNTTSAQVLIVGGGPVGLVLGMDLVSRGIDVLLVEERSLDRPMAPRTNHVSSRTMELMRRLGIADDIRAAGMPADYQHDVVYFTRLGRPELARVPIPAPARRWNEDAYGPDTWWPTPEPAHRCNQMYLDPILVEHALKTTGLRIVERTRISTVEDFGDRVAVTGTNVDTDEVFAAEAQFVIGCDGAGSLVRRSIGATLSGDEVVQHTETVLFRSPIVLDSIDGPAGWQLHFLNPRQSGSMISIDGKGVWLANIGLPPGTEPSDEDTRVQKVRDMLGIGPEVPLEVLEFTDYVGRRLVASAFRKGRLFICGDASHLWIPFAGYGMNAGLADAANLAWTLAAYLNGWGGEAMLDVYERERMPVTEQVSQYAMNLALEVGRKRSSVVAHIEEDSRRGLAARRKLGKEMYDIGSAQYCAGGLNFGYFYPDSPIIGYDGADHPPYTLRDFVQTTVPGHRTPHVWLADGRSLYDAVGPEYTLIRSDPSIDVTPLTAAAAECAMPLQVLDLDTVEGVYDHKLVLSRPDRHVGWRGKRGAGRPACVDRPDARRGDARLNTPLLLRGLRVIDGTGSPPVAQARLAIADGRLRSDAAEDALRLDARGLTALPGLINCHAHVMVDPSTGQHGSGTDAWEMLQAMGRLQAALDAGITTMRDLGGIRLIELSLRRAVETGLVTAPRLVCAGMRLTMTGGFFAVAGQEVDGTVQMVRAVRECHRAGADLVKLVASGGPRSSRHCDPGAPELTYEELAAGADEAKRLGLRVAAHAIGAEAIKNAARAGVTSVEHGNFLDAEGVELMLAAGCYLVPTLSVLHFSIEHAAALGLGSVQIDETRRTLDAAMHAVGVARAAGIPIALGTDAGTIGNAHHDVVTEFELLRQAGQSPMDVLVSATATAAALCGVADLGTLRPNAIADVVLTAGDPLADPGVLRRPALVIKGGEPVGGSLLGLVREAIRTGQDCVLPD